MASKKGSAAWKGEYHSVIVGLHTATKEIRRIYIRNDGGMSSDFPLHYPPPGCSAEREATIVFNLTKIKIFSIRADRMASEYEQMLRQELSEGDRD